MTDHPFSADHALPLPVQPAGRHQGGPHVHVEPYGRDAIEVRGCRTYPGIAHPSGWPVVLVSRPSIIARLLGVTWDDRIDAAIARVSRELIAYLADCDEAIDVAADAIARMRAGR
jgi:hypothetical protein